MLALHSANRNAISDAAFLGDSLTVGFSDYQINLGGALICGYTGVGPDAIVNRSAVKSPTRGQEVALDVLAAAQPKKLYILLGTNTLTTLGASDRFLAYYGQMLDMLREALGDDCVNDHQRALRKLSSGLRRKTELRGEQSIPKNMYHRLPFDRPGDRPSHRKSGF